MGGREKLTTANTGEDEDQQNFFHLIFFLIGG